MVPASSAVRAAGQLAAIPRLALVLSILDRAGVAAPPSLQAGELPNLRQRNASHAMDAPRLPSLPPCQFALRLDSGIGLLLALSLVVAVPWRTVAVVLTVGPFIHWTFSIVMFRLGLKPRPA